MQTTYRLVIRERRSPAEPPSIILSDTCQNENDVLRYIELYVKDFVSEHDDAEVYHSKANSLTELTSKKDSKEITLRISKEVSR